MKKLTYEERLHKTRSPLLRKLLEIVTTKKTNLCVAANFKTIGEVLEFAENFGAHFAILKLHSESLSPHLAIGEQLELLYNIKRRHNFLLFEDRKFEDGQDTTALQYASYVKYFDLVTISSNNVSTDVFDAIERVVKEANLPEDEPRGCLAVCEYSFASKKPTPADEILKVAESHPACVGIIGQKIQLHDVCSMFKATPGVHVSKKSPGQDSDQQWNHPSVVIGNGADIVIVGRGIISGPSEEMENRVMLYKDACWKAYCQKVVD